MKIKSLWGVLFLYTFIIGTNQAQASYFENLREDLLVPDTCRSTNITHFQQPQDIQYFSVSVRGGERRGYDYEYPGDRENMDMLWWVIDQDQHDNPEFRRELQRNPELQRDYQIILDDWEPMGFTWKNNGEVLELLAIDWFYHQLDPNEYFVTGSVAYHAQGTNILGELDIMIGQRSDCQIVSVGEAKLGLGSSGKARSQLARFRGFINNHVTPALIRFMSAFELRTGY